MNFFEVDAVVGGGTEKQTFNAAQVLYVSRRPDGTATIVLDETKGSSATLISLTVTQTYADVIAALNATAI